MIPLVLLRHGESIWNLQNRFTGWTDVDLTPYGIQEAHDGAMLLRQHSFTFDVAHTSVLRRAIRTLWIVLDDLDLMWIPVRCDWRLNERHYGALEGLSKEDIARIHGARRVYNWRRGYTDRPPLVTRADERYPGRDKRYAKVDPEALPRGESLQNTVTRLVPYWKERIVPDLYAGQRAIIVAHGNSLRALIKYLDEVDDDGIAHLTLPTGIPVVYELSKELRPLRHYRLGAPQEAR